MVALKRGDGAHRSDGIPYFGALAPQLAHSNTNNNNYIKNNNYNREKEPLCVEQRA